MRGALVERVRLVDYEPDLFRACTEDARGRARSLAVHALRLDSADRLRRLMLGDELDFLGMLVLEGLVARVAYVGGREGRQLFGPGDLIRPADEPDRVWAVGGESWAVLAPTCVAVLDGRFGVAAAGIPGLLAELFARTTRPEHGVALCRAIDYSHLHRRLLIWLWLMAARWGRVGPSRVTLDIPLTHSALAAVVGASRPATSKALSHLAREGLVTRAASTWTLHGEPPRELKRASEAA